VLDARRAGQRDEGHSCEHHGDVGRALSTKDSGLRTTRSAWPLRIAAAKLRPHTKASSTRSAIVIAIFGAFLYGDFALFRRIFRATAQVEELTPFFALGLLRNLLAMVFLISVVVLVSSAMTAAIGAFFTDLDLDIYHSAPLPKWRIVLGRWLKTVAQSATIVYVFLIPMFVAFARQYGVAPRFYAVTLINLALLLTIPVTIAATIILLLVRWFPVQRVHQIVATLAILVLTLAVVAFRVSRPERFFAQISTDDAARVLQQIELPSMDLYPGTALADVMVAAAEHRHAFPFPPRIGITALALFAIFFVIATRIYFTAFVRARESMAPTALGGAAMTGIIDRMLAPFAPPTRALIAKEVRVLTRDVAQWSQLFLMAALLFIYLYNVRMLPLGGDARATVVAYANLGMAGFVIAAICLRFAYPSVSSEGKAFWLLESSPLSYGRFLRVKVLVYATPLTVLSLLLTIFANLLLGADRVVWIFTLIGASLLAMTLVSLGVAMGAFTPNFALENPLQVGLSLGGFAYMGVSLAYVATMMLLMMRPVMRYFMWRMLGIESEQTLLAFLPVVTAVTLSISLSVFPLLIARGRLMRRDEK
jgi:ABC-2 type transport system permease protein